MTKDKGRMFVEYTEVATVLLLHDLIKIKYLKFYCKQLALFCYA